MEATKSEQMNTPAIPVSKLFMENTLLRVAGALFSHDAKHARQHTAEIVVERGVPEKSIVVRPDPQLGQPGPLAHKVFIALLKKHSSHGRPTPNSISFSKRELLRLVGRETWGGSASEQLTRAIYEIHHASVQTHFVEGDRLIEHSFHIFPQVFFERAQHASDPIEHCTVMLAQPIVDSLTDNHFTCLNHALMQQLGTIGQALYMRLFFHFANMFEVRKGKQGLQFNKRYDDICREWLGGIVERPHKSMIERDQLGPHLRQLAEIGFLKSCSIDRARTGAAGFVITFRPGPEFFADYERFYRRRAQGEIQFSFHEDEQEVAQPLKVAYLFAEKRGGRDQAGIDYVTTKDTQTAAWLLEQIPFKEADKFIDFALSAASETRFDIQTIGGLRQYVPQYLEARRALHREREAAMRRQAEETAEAARRSYEEDLLAAAETLFASLPDREQEAIGEIARSRAPQAPVHAPHSAAFDARMLRRAKARITAERYADRLPTFEAWSANRRSAC